MRIELAGEWEDREIRAGLRAARPIPLWAFPLASIVLIAITLLLESSGSLGRTEALVLVTVAATVAVAMVVLVPRQTRKLIDVPSLTGPVTGLLTDEAMFITSRNSSSTAPWSQFRSMKFNESAAALITGQRTCVLVLRNWFPDNDSWDTFTSSAPDLINRHQDSVAGIEGGDGTTTSEQTGTGDGLAFGGPFTSGEYRRVITRMLPTRRYGTAVILLGATLSALTLVTSPEGGGTAGFWLFGLISIAIGLLILYGLPALSTQMARRGVTAAGVSGTADATGIGLRYGSGQSDVDWSAFVKVVRTDRGLGLMLNDRAGIVVVRSWFDSEADWQHFVDLVDRHVEVG